MRRRRLHLSAIKLLDRHLIPENQAELVEAATAVREIEQPLATRFPEPDAPGPRQHRPNPSVSHDHEMATSMEGEPAGRQTSGWGRKRACLALSGVERCHILLAATGTVTAGRTAR